MLPGQRAAELHHFWRVIDGDHFLCGAGEQLREGAFARAQISHSYRREKSKKAVSQCLAGTSGHITATEAARQRVEIFARFVLAFPQDHLQSAAILRALRNFARKRPNEFGDLCLDAIVLRKFRSSVVGMFPGTTVLDYSGPFQLGEVTGDAGLSHAENVLELGDGEFGFVKKKQEPEPGRIGQEPE